jgi:hypothetical protein
MADKRPITTPAALAELTNSDSLIAGASAVLSEQGSSPSTPASGYGIVYAKTDGKLYFKNDAGTETDLTATGGGGGTDPVIREYTANDTWTKPTAANFWGILVLAYGAGGGGASGRRGASSSARYGGGAGGSGTYAYRIIRAATLAQSTYDITVGSGGAGGAGQTVNDTNGNNATAGGSSSFGNVTVGNLVLGAGGGDGKGGTTTNGTAGSAAASINCVPARGPYSINGSSGTNGSITSSAGAAAAGLSGAAAGAGGGGGGGISTANFQQNGGNGGGVYDVGVLSSAPLAGTFTGTRNGANGADIANNILLDINNPTTAAVGTGGGGGASGNILGTIAGGNGGNGGKGAGGGGGGASTNGADSGTGGNGGDGLVFVVEYYGA